MFQAWKWKSGYLYSQSSPDGEWRKCSADQTVEYLTECIREAADIAFEVNTTFKENLEETLVYTKENHAARKSILQFIGGE